MMALKLWMDHFRYLKPLCMLTAILLLTVSPFTSAHCEEPPDAWVLQLIHHPVDSFQSNVALIKSNPKESFAIVRDHWGEIMSYGSKQSLLTAFKLGASPFLLDVLDVAMNDDNANIRYAAEDQLIGFSFRIFVEGDNNAAYLAWKRSVAGQKQDQVVRQEEQAFFQRLKAAADPTERTGMLNALMRIDFASELPLCQTRREVAVQAHGLEIMGRFLAAESATVTDLYAVRMLQPDEPYLQKYVRPLTERGIAPPVRYAAISLLSAFESPTATEILLKMLKEGAGPDGAWVLRQALSASHDPKLIPAIIGVLEAEDDPQVDEIMQFPLQRLAQTFSHELHDGGWWRLWWHKNHTKFPQVTDAAIPHLKPQLRLTAHEPMYRRKMQWKEVAGDASGSYWLICPGYISGELAPASSIQRHFGLIVVICAPTEADDVALYWSKAAQSALNDAYYVAVIATEMGAPLPKLAPVSRSIVDDVSRSVTLDSNRCFLHGVGEGGMLALAVSSAPTTPFKGFYILSSPFRSASLPTLTAARGRKYYLQTSPTDKLAPMWQLSAGAEILKKQGATVSVASVVGDHGYKFEGDPWKPIKAAVEWLIAQNPK